MRRSLLLLPSITTVVAVLGIHCSAPSPSDSPAPGVVPAETADSGGASDGGTEAGVACSAAVDLERDPRNCGRCGRACDDGKCSAGQCAPRVEFAGKGVLDCADVFEVVEGKMFVRGGRTPLALVEAGEAKALPSAADLADEYTVSGMLATDGHTLFVPFHQGSGRTPAVARFDSSGLRGKDTASHRIPPYGGWMHAELGSVALANGEQVAVVSPAGAVQTFDIPGGASRVNLSRGELFAQTATGFEVYRLGAGAPKELFRAGGVEPWIVTEDAIFMVNQDPVNYYNLARRHRESGAATVLTKLDAAAVMAAVGGPGLTSQGFTFEHFVQADGTFFLPLSFYDLRRNGELIGSDYLVSWNVARGLRIAATYPESRDPSLKLRNGRLYWFEGLSCGRGKRVVSIPL